MPNRYDLPVIPASVCRSMSSNGATVRAPVLVARGRFIGAATARKAIERRRREVFTMDATMP
jgi:hypothetical protein